MVVVLLPSLMNNFQSSLPSLERTISTLEDFRNGGLREVLFNSDQRGTNYIVAWDMLKSSPLAGWGPAGFHRESSTFLILRLGYKLVVDSALNHYLMIGADLGLPVLFLSLVMIISPLVIALSTIKRLSDNKMRYVVAFTLAANIIFLILIITIPPTFFPGLVWVWTAQLAYLILIGGNYGIKKTITANRLRITFFIVLGILISVFFGAYQTTFGSKGYVARQDLDWWPYKYERNCYGTETWEDNILRWCKNNASMQFVIRSNSPSSNTFRAKLMVNHPDLKSRPVTVKYGGKEGTVNELLFQDYSTKEIEIPVTEEYIYELMSLQNTPYSRFVLNLDVSRTWVPKEWGGEDARELGVAVITPQNYEFFY
jgi:hypothetical protein